MGQRQAVAAIQALVWPARLAQGAAVMAAAFRWPERAKPARPKVGDMRVVVRFLMLPKKLGCEWRWLGFECIAQEFQRYRVQPPEMRAMDVVGRRDVAWDP